MLSYKQDNYKANGKSTAVKLAVGLTDMRSDWLSANFISKLTFVVTVELVTDQANSPANLAVSYEANR